MYISHYDQRSSGVGYALQQNASNRTIINSANGQELRFSINNSEIARVNEHGLGINATPIDDVRLYVKASDNDDGIRLDDAINNQLFKVFQQSTDIARMFLRGNGRSVFDLGDGYPSFIDLNNREEK